MAKEVSDNKRRVILRAVLLCVLTVSLLFLAIKLIDNWYEQRDKEQRGEGNASFVDSGLVSWGGSKNRKTPSVTTILIAGIDRETDELRGVGTSRYRNGGQADFLLLLAIDNNY